MNLKSDFNFLNCFGIPKKCITLEDKCPIGHILLALAEGPLGPLVKRVTDGVSQEGPSEICELSDLCIFNVTDLLIC